MRLLSFDSMEDVTVGDLCTHRPAWGGLITRWSLFMIWMNTLLFVNICGMCSCASPIVIPSYLLSLLKSPKSKEVCLKAAGLIRGRTPRKRRCTNTHSRLNCDGGICAVSTVRLVNSCRNGHLQFGTKMLRVCWGVAVRWYSSVVICFGRGSALVLWYSSTMLWVCRGSAAVGWRPGLRATVRSGGKFTLGAVSSLTFVVLFRMNYPQCETLGLDGLPNVKMLGTEMYELLWIGMIQVLGTDIYVLLWSGLTQPWGNALLCRFWWVVIARNSAVANSRAALYVVYFQDINRDWSRDAHKVFTVPSGKRTNPHFYPSSSQTIC